MDKCQYENSGAICVPGSGFHHCTAKCALTASPTVSPTPEPTTSRPTTSDPTSRPTTAEPTTTEPSPSPTRKPTHICPFQQEMNCCCPSCDYSSLSHSEKEKMLITC